MGWLEKLRGSADDPRGGGGGTTGAVPGRATVAPASTRKYTDQHDDNTDTGSFSRDEKLWVESHLTPGRADDGQPVGSGLQQVRQDLPIWVVSVLYAAGTNEPLARELPPSLEVPVTYDGSNRQIVAIDVDACCAELQPHRDPAVRFFKRTDSRLAPLRNAAALPGDVRAGASDAAAAWSSAIKDLSSDPSAAASWSAAEIEAMRRSAAILPC